MLQLNILLKSTAGPPDKLNDASAVQVLGVTHFVGMLTSLILAHTHL